MRNIWDLVISLLGLGIFEFVVMVIEGSRMYEWAVQKVKNKGDKNEKERETKRVTV